MIKALLKNGFRAIALLIVATSVYAQQLQKVTDIDFIEIKAKRLFNHRSDFIDFINPENGSFVGRDETERLLATATNVYDRLSTLENMLYIHSKLTCRPDKAMVASFAKMEIQHSVGIIEIELKFINGYLTVIKSPAIVASGTQLRDDLREIKERLEAIKFN